MSFYDNFLKIVEKPSESHRRMYQELVNYTFDNASTYWEDVGEEKEFGTLVFDKIEARINDIVDAKTGQRINDDYKKIIFRDLQYSPDIGTRYQFDDNIWMVFSANNIRTDSSSVYIRRCNNTMNTQDKYGNIHKEPCYIDYKVTEAQIFKNQQIDTPSGRIFVQCQRNQWTDKISINDRYIFSGTVYRVRQISKFDRRETLNYNTDRTVAFYAEVDVINEYDNFELEIADFKSINTFTLSKLQNMSCTVGSTGKFVSEVYEDGVLAQEPVLYISDNDSIVTIDQDGNYTAKAIGIANITYRMVNCKDINNTFTINVSEKLQDNYYNILSPNIKRIPLNKSCEFTVYEFNNDVKLDTTFTVKTDGPKYYCYTLNIIDGNTFIIKNLKTTDILLEITVTNNRDGSEIVEYIELGGLY